MIFAIPLGVLFLKALFLPRLGAFVFRNVFFFIKRAEISVFPIVVFLGVVAFSIPLFLRLPFVERLAFAIPKRRFVVFAAVSLNVRRGAAVRAVFFSPIPRSRLVKPRDFVRRRQKRIFLLRAGKIESEIKLRRLRQARRQTRFDLGDGPAPFAQTP